MPSNQTPLGALPARFRRPRVLIVGCGDIGLRAADLLGARGQRRVRLLALTSSPERVSMLRSRGITPLQGNLDQPRSLARLSGLAHRVLHLAPPPSDGGGPAGRDPRTRDLLRALRLRTPPQTLVYASTTGVYGDCRGLRITETRPVQPHTARALRRVDAEQWVRLLGRSGVRSAVLRVPGIYAQDRQGGTPRERLLKGTPVLRAQDDVYTNHIHASDLARACTLALWRAKPQRVIHVCDDTDMKMGDYFDLAADLMGLPRPPRIARSHAHESLPLMLLSFMSESRRLDNRRMKKELRLTLQVPHVRQGLSPQAGLFTNG
ncbi:MAG: NAD-dependent epimerase/dehydratase family protein [Limnohabitans sp.]